MNDKIVKLGNGLYKLGPLGNPKVLSAYLISDGQHNAIVDCGPTIVVEELHRLLLSLGVTGVDSLLLTHIHIDHAGGAGLFAELFPHCQVFVPRRGYKHLLDPTVLNNSAKQAIGDQLMNYWKECAPVQEARLHAVADGESVSIGERKIKYIPATGHAPHHNVLFEAASRTLFSADSLGIFDKFSGARTPTTPPPSFDLNQALSDIEMVSRLDAETVCLSHYGEVIGEKSFFESSYRVYETWGNVVSKYLSNGKKESNEKEIFSELESIYPEYVHIPDALKSQIMKIDITGLVQYFSKLNRSKSSSIP